ncbi:MAG: helix-turn-helix domain-containing protein [Rhizobiaceae bacterium]|nr:helix-turn-helix domain-containing protein [Rhizobiaceae bacterium]
MSSSLQTPIQVEILAVAGATMMTLASVIDPLRAANRLSGSTLFNWSLKSHDGQPVALSGGLTLPVTAPFRSSDQGDYLMVVASFDHDRHASSELVAALRFASRNFSTVCGVEAGTWLLARAGLIDGRHVTTHWEDLETLQQSYPDADIDDARFVTDGKIWTCGGASPAFDMLLHLIKSHTTSLLGLEVASVFVYDQRHTADDRQPTTSLGLLQDSEPKLAAAIRMMESHVDNPVTTAAIARRLQISVKSLEILFRRVLQVTPGAFYLNLRLQQARKLVIDTRLGMQEIAVRTGFGSQSTFSRAFRNAFGLAPLNLRHSRHQVSLAQG